MLHVVLFRDLYKSSAPVTDSGTDNTHKVSHLPYATTVYAECMFFFLWLKLFCSFENNLLNVPAMFRIQVQLTRCAGGHIGNFFISVNHKINVDEYIMVDLVTPTHKTTRNAVLE